LWKTSEERLPFNIFDVPNIVAVGAAEHPICGTQQLNRLVHGNQIALRRTIAKAMQHLD